MLEVIYDELTPGSVVGGRYRLERIVGEGGMGVVWAARHTLTGKKCALKFVKPTRAGDPRTYRRMLLEAQSTCAVNHPNVAQAHDILELPSGLPFIVMDFLEGEALSRRLSRLGQLSFEETARILLPVLDVVQAAHRQGIVHRDLKPANIFIVIDPHGGERIKVLDFGIAKRMHGLVEATLPAPVTASVLELTTFSALGTPSYMAPEQSGGHAVVDGRADVWALGVIVFECLSGARPESPEPDGPGRLAALTGALLVEGSELTQRQAETIAKALSLDPRWRPDLQALVHALTLPGQQANPRQLHRSIRSPSPRRGRLVLGVAGGVAVASAWMALTQRVAPRGPQLEPAASVSSSAEVRALTSTTPMMLPVPPAPQVTASSPPARVPSRSMKRRPAVAAPAASSSVSRPSVSPLVPAQVVSAPTPAEVAVAGIPSHERR